MAAKRRLPLVQSTGDADDDPKRAPWQWVGFGSLAMFVLWLPLMVAASKVTDHFFASRGSDPEGLGLAPPAAVGTFVGTSALALALAAFGGGFLVGRWGGPGVGIRVAALSGLATAIAGIALSWGAYGVVLSALVIVLIALPFAALGGKLGLRARR